MDINAALTEFEGNLSALARAVGVHVTTAWYWKQTGRVPAWRRATLKAAVEQRRRDLARVPPRRRRA